MARAQRDGSGGAGTNGVLGRLRGAFPTRTPSQRPPRVTLTKEDARRLNERFALLERSERRAIIRAVNRGIPMERRRDAELAIGVARRQQRFWTRAWLLGPLLAVVQTWWYDLDLVRGLFLAVQGSVLLGLMAAWWWTRARRAEYENMRVIGSRAVRSLSTDGGAPQDGGRRRSRLPGGPPVTQEASGEEEPTVPPASTARPPRPRGRKRR